ncbi:arylsulfatase B-like isoform X2 [Athalia rosae]|uniref:arylsulfatase B-like isoform X2 n=1 Tax=Athalia rosae TaxID=37344 RepID=UPI002033FC34|nr:arylsulfatase B-like isoform X2 [Athalia rosae]
MPSISFITGIILSIFFVNVFADNFAEEHANSSSHPGRHRPPHVIVIIADDLGWNDVSFHGSNQIPTPNIDALVANGIALNRHYVQPTCTPSRTAFLTGRYPIRSGTQGLPLRAGERWGIPLGTPLLPRHLKNLGYTTRLVGKWHVGYYSVDHTPCHRGFDSFLGYYSTYIKYFDHTIRQNNDTGYDLHRDSRNTSEVVRSRKYFTDIVTEEVENIIGHHDVENPLYLQIAHLAPHMGEPEDRVEVHDINEVNAKFGYIKDMTRRKYAGMVARLDFSVGRTVRALKNRGMLENSIILFTADNGAHMIGFNEYYGSNYPLRGFKFSLFDGGVRSSACIYSPLLKNVPRVSNELMHITDWLPTIYSVAGGNVTDLGEIDGVNQWPALRDGSASRRNSLLLNIDEATKVAGGIFGKFKLLKGRHGQNSNPYGNNSVADDIPPYDPTSVLNSDAGRAIASISNAFVTSEKIIELQNRATISCRPFDQFARCTNKCLFDLINDPCETVDISAKHPKIVERMENDLRRYNAVLMPQSKSEIDPASSPRNFGGVWLPWVRSNSSTIVSSTG